MGFSSQGANSNFMCEVHQPALLHPTLPLHEGPALRVQEPQTQPSQQPRTLPRAPDMRSLQPPSTATAGRQSRGASQSSYCDSF